MSSESALPNGNDWVILYSDKQDAYHVERRSEYAVKGTAGSNWQIVAGAGSWLDAVRIAGERRDAGSDKPCR